MAGDDMAGASHGSAGASRSDSAGLGWPPAPQMVVYSMNGCSGSSYLTRTSKDVIRCVQPGRWRFTQKVHDGEQFKGYKNLWYGEIQKENAERTESQPMAQGRIWAEVIRRMRAYAAARGETFLVNADTYSGSYPVWEDPEGLAELRAAGVKYVPHLWRANKLDQRVCAVKDCFHRSMANYPVYNGVMNRSICMMRRKDNATIDLSKYKAHLGTAGLASGLLSRVETELAGWSSLRDAGLIPLSARPTIYYETLVACQFPRADEPYEFDASVRSWRALLELLAVPANESQVRRCLSRYVGSYHRFPPHADVIANYREVHEALCGPRAPRASVPRYGTVCGYYRRRDTTKDTTRKP